MILTRVVSQDEWSDVSLNRKALRTLQVLFWRDSGTDDGLKALSHEGKICPVILQWRRLLDFSKKSA
jgi:hypothetical protein